MCGVDEIECHAVLAKFRYSGGSFRLSTVTTHTLDFDAVWGQWESLASVFWALAADTYALNLVIKATLQRDVLLIKLSVPPFEAEQVPFSARTVLLANLNTEPPEFYSSLPSVIIILVMQRIIPVSSAAVSVAVQKIFSLPRLTLSVTADADRSSAPK